MENTKLLLIGSLCAVLVAANAAGSKMISVGPLAASATVFAYALTFLITDLVSELYGKKTANRFVLIGFVSVLLSVVFFKLALLAPPASFYQGQKAFEAIFSASPRLLLGGLTAYLVSQHLDIQIFHFFKKLTKGKHMWLRNNGSTLCSQFIDTCIFITVAFYGVIPLWPVILGQYLIKVGIALLDTPVMYGLVYLIRKKSRERTPFASQLD